MFTSAPIEIPCVDYWPDGLPPEKAVAYKAFEAKGGIKVRKVIYSQTTGSVTVVYDSQLPHSWTRKALATMIEP